MVNLSKSDSKEYGVYQIKNTITNDVYIGSTIEYFYKRYHGHMTAFRKYLEGSKTSSNPILHNAFIKYGLDNFIFEPLFYIKDKKEVRIKEEQLIKELIPKYNVCKEPSKGGSPNLGRKLSQEWKDNIAKKSKQYTHSEESYLKVLDNNITNTPKIRIVGFNEDFITTIKNASEIFNCSPTLIYRYINSKKRFKGFKITRLSKQSKTIKVNVNNEELIFNSYGQCDKYFNMWRGYTSSTVTSEGETIAGYPYEIL